MYYLNPTNKTQNELYDILYGLYTEVNKCREMLFTEKELEETPYMGFIEFVSMIADNDSERLQLVAVSFLRDIENGNL